MQLKLGAALQNMDVFSGELINESAAFSTREVSKSNIGFSGACPVEDF